MSGLLKQALFLRSKRPTDETAETDLDVSDEERREITEQINAALRRDGPTLEEMSYTPQRRGIVLPLAVNLSTILLVATAILVVPRIMQPEAVALGESDAELRGAEALVIGSVREQAEAELQEKQQEITSIEARLAAADAERAELAEEFEGAIASREAALRAQLESELLKERARLEAEGAGTQEIEAEIGAIQAQREAALLEEIRLEREAAEAELTRREAELQAELAQARDARAALEEELQGELQAELQAERAGMEEELAVLRARDRQEQALLDQVNGFYKDIAQNIRAGMYASALSRLGSLTQFIGSPVFIQLPRLAQRREADTLTVEALAVLLEERLAAEASTAVPATTAEIALMRNQLSAIRSDLAAAQATAAERESQLSELQGEFATLQEELQDAEANLAARESDMSALRSNFAARTTQMQRANADLAATRANLTQAQTDLGAALQELDTTVVALLESRSRVDDVQGELARTRATLAELRDRRAQAARMVSAMRTRAAGVADAQAAEVQAADGDQEQVLSMLATKVQVEQLLRSEAIRAVYPDLHERMGTYLAALKAQSEATGRADAIKGVSRIAGAIRAETFASDAFDTLWATFTGQEEQESLLQFLDNLQGLVAE